jgi:molybdopterin converting factor small subunit
MIRDIREVEIELEQKIRTTYEIFSDKDSQDVLDNVNNLQRNRRECIDDLRAMALRIEDTINLIGNLSDTTEIDDNTHAFKDKLKELENECKGKDSRVREWNKENFNINLEVDQSRRVRGDFEGENRNLADLKGS